MREAVARLDPRGFRRRGNASSLPWHLAVNVVAASPALGPGARARLLRAAGLQLEAVIVEPGCFFFGRDVSLGERTVVSHRAYFDSRAPIRVGRDAGIGAEAMLITSSHVLGPRERRYGAFSPAPITIGDGAWVNNRVLVLPGVDVAPGCVIAAGAVVTRSTEPDGMYAGVPARRVRDLPT